MSLFKARDWWSTYAGSDEEFDLGCLCLANIDNNASQLGKVMNSVYSTVNTMERAFLVSKVCRNSSESYIRANFPYRSNITTKSFLVLVL